VSVPVKQQQCIRIDHRVELVFEAQANLVFADDTLLRLHKPWQYDVALRRRYRYERKRNLLVEVVCGLG